MTALTPAPGFLEAPFARRTWRAYGFLWVALLLAPFAFAYAVLTTVLTVGLTVTVVGLFVAGALVLGGRGWGGAYRRLSRRLLSVEIAEPVPRRTRRGFWRRLGGTIGDGAGWRAILYMAATFPLAIVSFVVSTVFLAVALGAMTHWVWSRFLPLQEAPDGTTHRGLSIVAGDWYWFADSPARHTLLVAAGLVLLFLWPLAQAPFVALFRLLAGALLGPTRASVRVAELERTRAGVVEDADDRLRRIERDLHDGTQARLVAVAMQLGEARDLLAAGNDADDVALAGNLVGTAHDSTKEALAELREIARGIHPPALDSGLAVALETLGARAPVPVTVDVDPVVEAGGRLAPAVESIAYYTVAELLTNVVKHADASGAYVLVQRTADGLRVRVRDDGRGGAAVVAPDGSGHRTGLAGLVDRVRAVDGTLDLSSPAGGPTVVTVLLPTQTRPATPVTRPRP
ncbi:signal transduction histidine kinase [Isoptericola sp. CG 20/1183]|uniref:histidine kinase n=1 Tax=Isoptericola halotolerans TaxID=300560 RepID=A0ABX5EEE1_9MICO|nr:MULTISPECIES: sensor histidine kinase [Isoptericola]PRZ04920.1 signal transduction histidine kinase [Isoptericola halotolerans]PRZ05411.1 signal transduction histidine kinase [Isoptericola sp. CG 20/1183]